MVEDGDKRVTVDDLRKNLGDLAADPMVALQLQELETVERVKDDVLPYYERRAEDVEDNDHAVKFGLEVIADYVKYNQRWNDTVKTLMAILKAKAKASAASAEPASPFTTEQIDILGISNGKQSAGKAKKTKAK